MVRGKWRAYADEETIRKGLVSMYACTDAANAASARSVHFILSMVRQWS